MEAGERIAVALEAILTLMQRREVTEKGEHESLMQYLGTVTQNMAALEKRSLAQEERNARSDQLTQQFSVYLKELQERTHAHEEQIKALTVNRPN